MSKHKKKSRTKKESLGSRFSARQERRQCPKMTKSDEAETLSETQKCTGNTKDWEEQVEKLAGQESETFAAQVKERRAWAQV